MCCNCCSALQQKIWVFTIGSLLALLGIFLMAAWPSLSMKLMQSSLALTPNSFTFSKWEITPVPLYINFYLYNWTNSHEVSNPNMKPHFQELGPYSFREIKIKEDISWNNNNSTVTFFGRRTWYFVPERSNGSLDDLIIAPNFATATASKISRKMNKVFKKIVNYAVNREGGGLTMTHSAIEWLYHGFYDSLIDFAVRLQSPLLPINQDKFAWFYGRNNSKEFEGTYNVHTGKSDIGQLGDLKFWKGASHTGFYSGECGKINGSTGEIFSPAKIWNEPITVFLSDLGRYINLFPKEKVNFKGIDCWVYKSTDQTFDSGYIAPDTKCFCPKNRECPKNGVVDYASIAMGSPMFLSHPHFYMADSMYLANTTGLVPNANTDEIFLLIEPKFGIPLKLRGHGLLSLLMKPDDSIEYLRDLAHTFYAPMFTLQMEVDMDDDLMDFLKLGLNVPAIGFYTGIALLVVAVAMVTTGVWLTMTHNWRRDIKMPVTESSR